MSIGLNEFLVVSGLLFTIGFVGLLVRRNTLILFMCLEIMLNGVNVALISFSQW